MARCPKCDAECDVQEAEPDVGIMAASAYCDACDLGFEVERDHHDDDVQITSAQPHESLGTPISQLSGRPGHEGYAEWRRIARSWGYD